MREVKLREKVTLILLGLIFCLIIIEIGLHLGGFIFLSLQEVRNVRSMHQKNTFRILCLGESTTALGGKYAYPEQLEKILRKSDLGIKISVINKGIPAGNTAYILKNLEGNLDRYRPQLVLAMMGINDSDKINFKKQKHSPGDSFNMTYIFLKELRLYRLAKFIISGIRIKRKEARLLKELKKAHPDKEKFTQVRVILQRSDELNLLPHYSNLEIIRSLFDKDSLSEAESLLKLRENVVLGKIEDTQIFKKVLNLTPQDVIAWIELARIYIEDGEFAKAEGLLNNAIELNEKEYRLYLVLAECYEKMGKYEKANECYERADKLRYDWYFTTTRYNLKELKKILDKRGIKLACVQYPMRSIEPLKEIFKGKESIIFIDNEEIFKRAVRREGYKEYFINRFAGDFGHCTPKGNKLLAENIANTIIKEYFSK